MKQITVFKDRTTRVSMNVGLDVSSDTITSQIRVGRDRTAQLIAEWAVTYLTDGTDGELVLTMGHDKVNNVEHTIGYMDLKRVSGGEPMPVFDEPIEVFFKDSITI